MIRNKKIIEREREIMKTKISNVFTRSLTAVAVAASLGLAMPAAADNSAGSVYGVAKQGQTVVVKNIATGAKRTVVIDESGRFNFKQMPTGKYEVTNGTEKYTVTVSLGTGTNVQFVGDQVERVEIRGARISAIDTSSVEATTVFTAEQIELLPVGRDLTDVALLAPGTTKGDAGFGNLASFGGASVAENGYFINGFDVTNLRTFISFADLPFDAIGQQQVKTGGYGAEYGRALGGVINVSTKRGSNEFNFGGAVYSKPDSLRSDRQNVKTLNPETPGEYAVYRSENEYSTLSYNTWASGAIVEDRLFFFAMAEGQKNTYDDYNKENSDVYEESDPQFMVKLDWQINDDHLLELTHISNEQDRDYITYDNTDGALYTGAHGDEQSRYTVTNGGDINIVKYTGFITDDLTVSALWGNSSNAIEVRSPDRLPGWDCPRVFDSRDGGISKLGCWDSAQTTIADPDFKSDEDTRDSLRLGLEYVIGDHSIKVGYDHENYKSDAQGWTYTGGTYWRYFTVGENGKVNNVNDHSLVEGDTYVRQWDRYGGSASFEVENTALYIEDNWQATDDVLVYLGLRNETFENRNGIGETFIEADELIAPRLGLSWDVDGDSTKKVFANWGRYYIPVASNSNIRAAGVENFDIKYFYYDSIDPTTAEPIGLGEQIGPTRVNGSPLPPDSRTIADVNLNPMHQDELIIGYQQALTDDFTLGIRYINREVQDGMDDFCSHQGFVDWAEDEGYDNFDYHSMAGCMFVNPGADLTFALDVEGDGNLEVHTISNDYFNLPKYERTYNAVELFWERAMTDGLYFQGSYTWAQSLGNAEGYVNSTLEQEDPGLTQDFDHARFMAGSQGPLPNDRRHTLKLFGVYEVNDQVSVSANFLAQSGRPQSCYGYIDLDNLGVDEGGLSGYSGSSLYCLDENAERTLGSRGNAGRTPWIFNLDAGIQYKPEWVEGLTLRADITNLFDLGKVTEYDEFGESTRDVRNPDYQQPVGFQAPRSVRLTARYTFK